MSRRTALIIGAGPAGLTAALELLTRTDIHPIVLEESQTMGGISRTVEHHGNRIDIGGHRFFSKSDRVMHWWLERMPLEATDTPNPFTSIVSHLRPSSAAGLVGADEAENVMLVRSRKSRIYYGRKFYDYPIRLSAGTLRNLGPARVAKIGASYAAACLAPIRDEQTLEDFFINRFGRELYNTFFKSYTEKVWGRPCSEISADWGAQRVKGLSILKTLLHAATKPFSRMTPGQKNVETSLIEQFLYPKYGPGQLWERAADEVLSRGGEIRTGMQARHVRCAGDIVTGVVAADQATGKEHSFDGDYVFSSMPVKQLVRSLTEQPPTAVREISEGLVYRDFLTVGLLVDKLAIRERDNRPIRDNWIYIQEPDVCVGRLQIFNNWSPYMVADPSKTWVGLEYFCNENDGLWVMPDAKLVELAVAELRKIGFLDDSKPLDATVIRMPKAYPAYFGTYDRFDTLRDWLDRYPNLLLIGRNGMHRYNNMDHSMLTAMTAVDNIVAHRRDHENIWAVNAEKEYHETADAAKDELPDQGQVGAGAS